MPSRKTFLSTYSLCSWSKTGELAKGEKPKAGMPSARRKRESVPAGKISGSIWRPAVAHARLNSPHQGLVFSSVEETWCAVAGVVHGANSQERPSSAHQPSSIARISAMGVVLRGSSTGVGQCK